MPKMQPLAKAINEVMNLLEALEDEDRDAVVRFVWAQYHPPPVDKTGADRVRRHREKKKAEGVTRYVTDDVTGEVTCYPERYDQLPTHPPTKLPRKPPKKKKAPTPAEIPKSLQTPEFLKAWEDWKADRKDRKKPMTVEAEKRQLKQLMKHKVSASQAVEFIDNAIAGGWQGLWVERQKKDADRYPKREPHNGYFDGKQTAWIKPGEVKLER